MKVIATPDTNWKKEIQCNHSKSKLEINGNDIRFRLNDREGIWETYYGEDFYYVRCGVCSLQIEVHAIPSVFRAKAKAIYGRIV